MEKKERLYLYWHKFWGSWHQTKAYYYGSERHRRKQKKHEEALINLHHPTNVEKRKDKRKLSFKHVKQWIIQKKAGLRKPAEE